MFSKIYTAPGLTNAPALRYELLVDEGIALAGVTIETSSTIVGTSTVTVFADVDPSIADAEIQAVIDAHDPDADWVPPAEDQELSQEPLPTYPFIGIFADVADLPDPTEANSIAVVRNSNGASIYVRNAGAWELSGPYTVSALETAVHTAQCGGDPAGNVTPYPVFSGFVWESYLLRSTAAGTPWGRYALAGKLEDEGDRIDWHTFAAQPDGGELGIVFLPAGTVPAPADSPTITGAWSGQWTGGLSYVLSGNKWKTRGKDSQGSGFSKGGPDLTAGQQLSIVILKDGSVEVRRDSTAKTSDFTVPVGGLDVWVTTQTVEQRWAPAFATNAALPVPGVVDPPDSTVYIPTHALSLDGNNDIVEVPNGVDIGDVLLWDSDWTISVRLPSNNAVDTSYYQTLLGRGPFNGLGLNRIGTTLRLHAFAYGAEYSVAEDDFDLTGAVLFFEYDSSAGELCLHVGDDLIAKLPIPSAAASSAYADAPLVVGAMEYYGTAIYAWEGNLHEAFIMGRTLTDTERADAVRDPNLANHSWYGDVLGWWPLGTGDVDGYPTMRNLIAGASDGTLTNSTPSAIIEI